MSQIQKTNPKNTNGDIEVYKSQELLFNGIVIDPDIALTRSQKQYVESINYSPVIQIEQNELIKSVFVIISNNLRALQSKMRAEDQVLLTNDMVQEIINDFPNYTIKEIERIIYNGIRGKYDNEKRSTIGFSIVNFNIWAREYNEIKFRMNITLDTKIKVNNSSDPEEITEESLISLIKGHYDHLKINYDEIPAKQRKLINYDDYFVINSLRMSSKFIFKQLVKLNLVNLSELGKEVKLLKKNKFDPRHIEGEAQRIYCCKYYLTKK